MINDACPDYYKMSHYVDLNHWCADKLRSANWAQHEQALLLNILWPLLLRYVVRLPFKATRAADAVKDIDKALSLLHDLRAVFVPPAEPEPVQAPQASTTAHRPLCPNQCGNRLLPTPAHDKARGDWRCMDCPTLAGTGTLNAYFWQRDLEAPPAAPACPQCGGVLDRATARFADRGDWWCVPCLKTFWQCDLEAAVPLPWHSLTETQKDHIRTCAAQLPGQAWYHWKRPDGTSEVFPEERRQLHREGGVVRPVPVPAEVSHAATP